MGGFGETPSRNLRIPLNSNLLFMSARIALKVSIFGGGLFLLDRALQWQRMSRAQRMKVLLGMAIAASIILLVWSLAVVVRVNASTKSMVSDGLVGINTTIALGRELTEMQAQIVSQNEGGEMGFSPQSVEEFRRQFDESFARYSAGVFSFQERRIFTDITAKYQTYVQALQARAGTRVSPTDWADLYKKGQDLRVSVRAAMIYNANRLEAIASNVRSDTQAVFVVFCILIAALISIMVLGTSVLMFTRLISDS